MFKTVKTDQKFYVVSLRHTRKRSKFITLWGPDNAGYHYSRELSGIYDGYQVGYHDNEDNMPITTELAESLFKKVIFEGKEKHMIPNKPHSWNRLGLSWKKGDMIRLDHNNENDANNR